MYVCGVCEMVCMCVCICEMVCMCVWDTNLVVGNVVAL